MNNIYGINTGAQTEQDKLNFQRATQVGGAILGAAGGFAVGGPAGAVAGGYGGYEGAKELDKPGSDTAMKKDKAEARGFAKGAQAVAAQVAPPSAAQRIGGALLGAAGIRPGAVRATAGGNAPPWAPPNISNVSGGANIGAAIAASRQAKLAQVAQAPGAGVASAPAPARAAPRPLYGPNAAFGTVDYNPYGRSAEKGPAGSWGVATDTSEFAGAPQQAPIDQSTVTPATSSQTWGARAYGIQNPELDAPMAAPAAAPPVASNAAPWLDTYMAGQPGSDTEVKRNKERAAGFAEAMQQIDPSTSEFESGSAPSVKPVDVSALDAAQRSQGGPVNDMRPAVGYTYRYKDPNMPGAKPGKVAGPMAQDIEHTIAADAVQTAPDGFKRVDTNRLSLHNTAAIGEQQTELEKLKAQLNALAGKKPLNTGAPAVMPRIAQADTSAFQPVAPVGAY